MKKKEYVVRDHYTSASHIIAKINNDRVVIKNHLLLTFISNNINKKDFENILYDFCQLFYVEFSWKI